MIKHLNNLGRKFWQYRLFRHLTAWVIPYFAFLLLVAAYETPRVAFNVTTTLFLPAPLTVYLHFFVLKRFFEKRRYLYYGIGLIGTVALSAYVTEGVHRFLVKDPNSHTSGVGAAVLAITLTTGFYYFGRGIRQQYRLQEVEAKQAQTELALLRSQLHPHFLFNTLNNLYALALDRSELMPDVILKLADMLRYTLDTDEQSSVPLIDEIRFLENYFALEKLRVNGEPNLTLSVEGDSGSLEIAPMLLIPFVENGFKHSNLGLAETAFLHISVGVQKNSVKLTVKNTYENDASRRTGIGLLNVQRRLNLVYPEKHKLDIDDHGGIHEINLELEFRE